jgi:CPA2 family monovalent cation:H+ antiporter-2
MTGESHFLQSLAVVLCTAAATTVVCQRIKLPPVLGYLAAGVLIGPNAPILLVQDTDIIQTLSELGVILLMFYIGMELSLKKLGEVGAKGAAIGMVEMGLMLFLGTLAGRLAGFGAIESAFLAAIVTISSTTIIAKTFEDQTVPVALKNQVFGVLVIEDVVAILLIALLTTLATTKAFSFNELALAAGRLGIFLAVLVIVGLVVVPRLIRFVVRLNKPETTLVTAVGVCFAAALAAEMFGYSVALGAFIAGCLIAESGESHRISLQVRPLRDVFTAVFFVSVGMSIDPLQVWANLPLILGLVTLVVLGKFVGVAIGFFATGSSIRMATRGGMAMGQIGEFSFIIAALGVSLQAVDPSLYPIAVGVSAITVLITPFAVAGSDRVASFVDHKLPRPIQTFAALYASWLEQLAESRDRASLGAKVGRLGRWIVIDAALFIALVIAASAGSDELAAWLALKLPVAAEPLRWAVLGGFALLAIPMLLGLFRLVTALGRTLALAALPKAKDGDVDFAHAPRRAFVVSLQLGLLVLVLLPCMAILQPFLPTFGFVPLLLILLLTAIVFWRRATQLQGHVRAGAQALVEAVARPGQSHDEQADALDQMESLLPGLGDLAPFPIAVGSPVAGQRLADIDLRSHTGATVLAIRREGESVLTPDGSEALRVGDILVLAGTHEAIAAARALLSQVIKMDDALPRRPLAPL